MRKSPVNKDRTPDVFFTTPKGLYVKLSYDKEYRAFKHVGNAWVPMNLGASFAEPLQNYINKYF